MVERKVKLSSDERAMLIRIVDGTLHVDCLTRPRAVSALLDLGLIDCDGEHFIATTRAASYLTRRNLER